MFTFTLDSCALDNGAPFRGVTEAERLIAPAERAAKAARRSGDAAAIAAADAEVDRLLKIIAAEAARREGGV